MSEQRQHPKVFTVAEATAYCHLDSERSLETLEKDFGLAAYRGVGKSRMFWQDDLDDAILRWFGRGAKQGMRIAK